jgi:hypothetical protein
VDLLFSFNFCGYFEFWEFFSDFLGECTRIFLSEQPLGRLGWKVEL